MVERKTLGLALGSGSSRGWAHIGAIEALEEEGIPIDCIAGCSIGSYVGALYASGGLNSLKTFVLKMDGKKVFSYFDVVFPRSGLLDATKKINELFTIHTAASDFSDLKIPVVMVATDLKTGEKVILKSGKLVDSLHATMSVPGLFAPARINNRWLVDGGLVDPVPVGVLRAMAVDVVIAVDLNCGMSSRRVTGKKMDADEKEDVEQPREFTSELMKKLVDYYENAEASFTNKLNELLKKESDTPDIIETVMTSISIMQNRITRINLAVDPPDILVQPRLGDLKMMDFDQVERTIEEGYIGVKKKIDDVRALLEI